ncbi:MAG TPA: SURF1 family protein [Noviherbaspirillum sp.]|nr:SURF1 family protein [Noviherbaspirillum sp.]
MSRPRSSAVLVALAIGAAFAFTALIALGTWQLYRLQWKLTLIERVEQRVHATPVPAPGPDRWPQVTAETDEYRHVRVTGRFLYGLTTRVLAATELGSGYWLLTPLRTEEGHIVLVNRGFVPSGSREAQGKQGNAESSLLTVTGLLRISEPAGGFLRKNDPAANRWYSRDVQAIAAARGLRDVAPYFIDAEASPDSTDSGAPDRPVAGLTVVTFHNNHLVYAITWYALALMVLGAALWVAREERRMRRTGTANQQSDHKNDRDRGQ